jgi:glutamine synthetase
MAIRKKKKRTQPRVAVAKSPADAMIDKLVAAGVTRAKVGGFDIDGVLRGKYISLEKLASALDKGFGFCDVIFGWDVADVLYDNGRTTGFHTGYPDAHAVLDPSTQRIIPWEPDVAAFLADFRTPDGKPHPACPRSVLKRVIDRGEKQGFSARFSAEFEFFFFRESRESLRDKGFRDLQPLDPGMFGYSWIRSGQDRDLMHDLLHQLDAFDIPLEGLHTETGPGVYEAAIAHDDTLAAADKAALLKTAVKEIAHRHGLSVTFMAKWNAHLPGASGHLHQSLWSGGRNVFYDARARRNLSKTMRAYVGGQMALMRELTAMYSPTINSYKRYVPGVWAPLVASWGEDNRTCAIRLIDLGNESGQRVEYRQTAADINPYLAIAACFGAGLWGIDKGLEPPAETRGDAGCDGPLRLPTTLAEATQLFQKSKAARALFGAEFVDHYARTRDFEVRSFDRAVTDWELARYFEII